MKKINGEKIHPEPRQLEKVDWTGGVSLVLCSNFSLEEKIYLKTLTRQPQPDMLAQCVLGDTIASREPDHSYLPQTSYLSVK